MGKLTGGIDNDMIGRLGNHVGRRVKGENIISMRPAKSNRPPTPLQYDQRLRFGLVTNWLSWIGEFIKIGFQHYDNNGKSAMNAAVQYNLEKAVTGTSPNFLMDYADVLVSRGKLAKAYNPEVATLTVAQLDFSWDANTGTFVGAETDKAVFIVYNPAKHDFAVQIGGVTRDDLQYDMVLPADYSLDTVHIWMAFVSADEKEVSTSQYLGSTAVL